MPPACREAIHGWIHGPLFESRHDLVDHVYGVRFGSLLNGQPHRVRAVLVAAGIARALVEHHVSDVAEHQIVPADGEVGDRIDRVQRSLGNGGVALAAIGNAAEGQVQRRAVQGLEQLGDVNAVTLDILDPQVDIHLLAVRAP